MAANTGYLEQTKALIQCGANVNLALKRGTTPLYIAAQEGYLDISRLLIEHGAEVNTQNMSGATALFIAAQQGHADIVKTLLDHGADCSLAVYQSEIKYLDFCKENDKGNENRMLQFLLNEYWNSSIVEERSSVSGFLKWSFFNVVSSVSNYYKMTPIQIAEVMGHTEIVNLLQTHTACAPQHKQLLP
jgi:ankyrin repeat protein